MPEKRGSRVKHLFVWLSMCLICFSAVGCSLKNQVVKGRIAVDEAAVAWPDQELADKFKEYWGYRCEGDADRSFVLEASYAREMIVPERYNGFIRGAKGIQCTGIKIEKIEQATAQLVRIDFYLKFRNNNNVPGEAFYRDSWIVMDNQWSHAFKDPFILPD